MDFWGGVVIVLGVGLVVKNLVDLGKETAEKMPDRPFQRFLYIIFGIPLIFIGFIVFTAHSAGMTLQQFQQLIATPTPTFKLPTTPFHFPTPNP